MREILPETPGIPRPFLGAPTSEAHPCLSCCVPYRPRSTMRPSLMTRIWSALTTVESLRGQRSVTHHNTRGGPSTCCPFHTCVPPRWWCGWHRLWPEKPGWPSHYGYPTQTLPTERDLGKTVHPTRPLVGGGCKWLAEASGIKKDLVLRLKTEKCFCETCLGAGSLHKERCSAGMAGHRLREEGVG